MAADKNFDIDDQLAFDDFNIDAIDADTPKGKVSKAKKIVSTLFKDISVGSAKGVRRAIRSKFTETGEQLDDLQTAYTDGKQALSEITDALGPVTNSLKKITLGFMPLSKKLLPRSIYEKSESRLKAHTTEEEETPEQREARQRQEQMQASLDAIFKTQKSAAEADVAMKAAGTMQANIRFKHQQIADRAIISGLKQIVTYIHGPTTAYMKKSLELQYQHLFIAKDMYRATAQIGSILNAKLEEIKHNTSLPESVKVNSMKRKGVLGAVGSLASKTLGGLLSTMVKTGKDKILSALKDAQTALSIAEGSAEGASMMAPFTLLQAISTALGWGANWASGKAMGDKLYSMSNTVSEADKGITGLFGHIKRSILNKIKLGRNGEGGWLGSLLSWFAPEESKTDRVTDDAVKNPTKAISYDVSSKTALTKIIPKHLERIGDYVEAAFSTQQKFVTAWSEYANAKLPKKKGRLKIGSLETDVAHREYNVFDDKLTSHEDVLKSIRTQAYRSDKDIGRVMSGTMALTRTLALNGPGERVNLDKETFSSKEFEIQYAQFLKNIATSRNHLDIDEIVDLQNKFREGKGITWRQSPWERDVFANISEGYEQRIVDYIFAATHYRDGSEDMYSTTMLRRDIDKIVAELNPMNALKIAMDHNISVDGMAEGERKANGTIRIRNDVGANVSYFEKDARTDVADIADRSKRYKEDKAKLVKEIDDAPINDTEKDRLKNAIKNGLSLATVRASLKNGGVAYDIIHAGKTVGSKISDYVKKLQDKVDTVTSKVTDTISSVKNKEGVGFIVLQQVEREIYSDAGDNEAILYVGLFTEAAKTALLHTDKISDDRRRFIENKYKPLNGDDDKPFSCQVVDPSYKLYIKDTRPIKTQYDLPEWSDVRSAWKKTMVGAFSIFKGCLTKELWDELCTNQHGRCRISSNLAVRVVSSSEDIPKGKVVSSQNEPIFSREISADIAGDVNVSSEKPAKPSADKNASSGTASTGEQNTSETMHSKFGEILTKFNAKKKARQIKNGRYEIDDRVLEKLDTIISILGVDSEGTGKGRTTSWSGPKKIWKKIVNKAVSVFDYLKERIGTLASSAMTTIADIASSVYSRVRGAATTTLEKAKEMWEKGKVWIKGKWESAKEFGIETWEQAKELAQGSWETIKEKAGSAKSWLQEKYDKGKKYLFGDETADTEEARIGLIGRAKAKITQTWTDIKDKVSSGAIGRTFRRVANFIRVPNYVDIYLKDKVDPGNPLLSKKKQEDGVFFDDGKKVEHSYDIDRPVFDSDRNVVISQEDLKTGLVNIDNKPIAAGLINKLTDAVKSWADGGVGGVLKKAWGGIKGAWNWFTGKVDTGVKKTTSFFKSMFGIGGEDFAEYHNSVLASLDKIIGMLHNLNVSSEAKTAIPNTTQDGEAKAAALQDIVNNAGDLSDQDNANSLLQQYGEGYMSKSGEKKKSGLLRSTGRLAWSGLKGAASLSAKGVGLAGKGYWNYLKFVGRGYRKGFGLIGSGIKGLFGKGEKSPEEKKKESVQEKILNEIKKQTDVQEEQLQTLNETSDTQSKQLKLQEDANKKPAKGSIAAQKEAKERQDKERKERLEKQEKLKNDAAEKLKKKKQKVGTAYGSDSFLNTARGTIDKFLPKQLRGMLSLDVLKGRAKVLAASFLSGKKGVATRWSDKETLIKDLMAYGMSKEEAERYAETVSFDIGLGQKAGATFTKVSDKVKQRLSDVKGIFVGNENSIVDKAKQTELFKLYRSKGLTAAEALKKAKSGAGGGGLLGQLSAYKDKLALGEKFKNSKVASVLKAVKGKAISKFAGTKAGASILSSLSKAGPGVLAKMGPLLANPYVLAGTAAAALAGGSIYGGIKGWKKAGANWGLKQGQKATATQKASSAIAGALTFGFGGKRATKAINAAMEFGGANNLIKAFGGNKAVMDAKDIEKFQKKCAVHIQKGEKQYERMLSRFNKAVSEEDWPMARAISGNEISVAKELGKSVLKSVSIVYRIGLLRLMFKDKNKEALTQKQIDAFTKKMTAKIRKGDKNAERVLSKFQVAVADENWVLARELSGKKVDGLLKTFHRKWARLSGGPLAWITDAIMGSDRDNVAMKDKEIKAATARLEKWAAKSAKGRKTLSRFNEAIENEDWKTARALSGNKLDSVFKRDMKLIKNIGKWSTRIATLGLSMLFEHQDADSPLTQKEIDTFVSITEKKIKKGNKQAQRQLDSFNEAIATQQWKRARKIAKIKLKDPVAVRAVKASVGWLFGSQGTPLKSGEIDKFRNSMERKIDLGGPGAKIAERKLEAFNDAVEEQNWKKARQISKMKHEGIFVKYEKAKSKLFDKWFIGSMNSGMSEKEIKSARAAMQDAVTLGVKGAQKRLDMFEDAVADENWRKARLIAKVKATSGVKRMATGIADWFTGASEEMSEMEINKFTSSLQKTIDAGGPGASMAKKRLEMFERAVDAGLWKRARAIAGMEGRGVIGKIQSFARRMKPAGVIGLAIKSIFGGRKGEYSIQDCNDIRKDLQNKVENDDNSAIWERILTMFDAYVSDGNYTAAYNYAEKALEAGTKELKQIGRDSRGLGTVEEDLQLAARAKDIEANIRKSREKINSWLHPIQYFKLGRLISKVQDMSMWSTDYFDDIELELNAIDEEAGSTADTDYSKVDPKQKKLLEYARVIKLVLLKFRSETAVKYPKLAKRASDLLAQLDIAPNAYTEEQLNKIYSEYKQLKEDRKTEEADEGIMARVWKGIKKGSAAVGSALKSVWSAIKSPFRKIGDFFGRLGSWFSGVTSAFAKFSFAHPIDSVNRILDAVKGVGSFNSKSGERRIYDTHFSDASDEGLSPMQMANAIKNHKYESAVAYDKNGKIVNAANGDEGSVDIKGVRGGTIVHNHPDGSPITESDKAAARSQGLHAVTVASPNGVQTTTFNSVDGVRTRFNGLWGWMKDKASAGKSALALARTFARHGLTSIANKSGIGTYFKTSKYVRRAIANAAMRVPSLLKKIATRMPGILRRTPVSQLISKYASRIVKPTISGKQPYVGRVDKEDISALGEKLDTMIDLLKIVIETTANAGNGIIQNVKDSSNNAIATAAAYSNRLMEANRPKPKQPPLKPIEIDFQKYTSSKPELFA